MKIHELLWPEDRIEETRIPPLEETMKTRRLPQTDSIEELARFWDTHDLTDFEDQLEEVTESVFELQRLSRLGLEVSEADAIRKIALKEGVSEMQLLRRWIREKLQSV